MSGPVSRQLSVRLAPIEIVDHLTGDAVIVLGFEERTQRELLPTLHPIREAVVRFETMGPQNHHEIDEFRCSRPFAPTPTEAELGIELSSVYENITTRCEDVVMILDNFIKRLSSGWLNVVKDTASKK